VRGNSSSCIKGMVRFSYGRARRGSLGSVGSQIGFGLAVRFYGIVLNGAGSFMELAVD